VTVKLTPKQKLVAARAMVKEKAPYFRAALNGAVYVEMPGLNTMAMSKDGVLFYDSADLERLSVEEAAASLVHELLHWLRDHSGRREANGAQPKEWNIACDCEINDDLVGMKFTISQQNADLFVMPSHIGAQPGKTGEEYYSVVRNMKNPPKIGQNPKGGAGWCGSAAGRPIPNEPDTSPGKKQDDGSKDKPGTGDGRTESEADRMRKQVAEAAKKHEVKHGRGSVPAGFSRWADAFLTPPKVDWRQKLAKVMRATIAFRPGAVTTTWKAFGRKQAALGFGPGKPLTPAWRNPVPRVAIAVDTSGSMGQNELLTAACEIDGILRAINSEAEFTACDCAVHSVKTVRTAQEAVKEFKGGGGTSFIPVFEFFAKRKTQLPPEVLIFVTDGDGWAPDKPPPGMRVIWVLVGPYRRHPATWGEVIEIDDTPVQKKK